jgi:hypothetical protein
MHVNNACIFYAQYASIVVWKSQNGAETLVNFSARKKLTCFDPLRKGCSDFFYFFWQLLVQQTIPTTFNSHKNNFDEIILFQNSPVQPLPQFTAVMPGRNTFLPENKSDQIENQTKTIQAGRGETRSLGKKYDKR